MARSYSRYRSGLVPVAHLLRRQATVPERLLWARLRRRQLGVRFLRQRPVGAYVVDFLAPEIRLVVEVDARSHDGRGDADRRRQAELEALGYRVVRVRNDEVLRQPNGVARRLSGVIEEWIRRIRRGAGP